jgi:hypothetical protein
MWENTKVTYISRQQPPVRFMIDQQLGNVEHFSYVGSMMQDVQVKLYPGLPRQKQHSTRRIFSPVNFFEI